MFHQVMQSHANSPDDWALFHLLDRYFKSSDTMTEATGIVMHRKVQPVCTSNVLFFCITGNLRGGGVWGGGVHTDTPTHGNWFVLPCYCSTYGSYHTDLRALQHAAISRKSEELSVSLHSEFAGFGDFL